jgi:glycosyltransferase involved in cell wall biosynthesis
MHHRLVNPRLLFLSNLFPTVAEPYRGLDNATLLHSLAAHFEIRVLSPRPVLPWSRKDFSARPEDASLHPRWAPSAYQPKIGSRVNHLLMSASLRHPFDRMLHEFQPDVLLSSWIYPDSCAAVHVAHGRVPIVAIAQGTDIHKYLDIPARRRAILKYLPHAAAVITRSRELSRLLADAAFPPAKLHTVYNGVSLETFQPRDQAQARRDSNLPEDARIILFVGNFYPVKNPLLLIRALAGLETSAHLVMAGGGPLEEPARKLASSLGLASRVIFTGRKTPSEIARLMNAADLLALPSDNEGVPNVLLEAFASGLPVVASRVGGIPEVLDHDTLGRMAPPGDLDALVTALRDQLATPRDPAAIRRHAQRFSWESASSAYREILLAAID